MKLLINEDEYYSFLAQAVQGKPNSATIVSYGLYAGILPNGNDATQWGEKYKSKTRDVLESLRNVKDVKIMIGLYKYKSCKGKGYCFDCEKKYVSDLIRHMSHAEYFQEFRWRTITESHIKCILFDYNNTNIMVSGGRNFTDSNWDDITFATSNKSVISEVSKYVNELWDNADVLCNDNISKYLSNQGIKPDTISMILNDANE